MAKANITIEVRDGESIEKAIRRFRRICEKNQILSDIKKKQFYSKPSVIKKEKKKRAIRAQRKLVEKDKVNY